MADVTSAAFQAPESGRASPVRIVTGQTNPVIELD
jgi:hypothetical protein